MKKQNLTQYEVAFVVQGYLKAEDGDIGELTCNGLVETDGVFYLKDGRWYYTAAAESPQEAYDHAVLDFEAACIGEVEITDWFLEHVSDEADNYWYREVLKVQRFIKIEKSDIIML